MNDKVSFSVQTLQSCTAARNRTVRSCKMFLYRPYPRPVVFASQSFDHTIDEMGVFQCGCVCGFLVRVSDNVALSFTE